MLKKHGGLFLSIFVLMDLVFLIVSYFAARYIALGELGLILWSPREIFMGSICMIIVYFYLEKIEFSHQYRFKPLWKVIYTVIKNEFFIVGIFYLFTLFKLFEFKTEFLFAYVIITFCIFFSERVLMKIGLNILRTRGYNFKRYLIIGAGSLGLNFYRRVTENEEFGIKIIGFLDDDEEALIKKRPQYTQKIEKLLLGKTDKIETILKTYDIDNVVIALPVQAERTIVSISNICEKNGIRAELIPNYYKIVSSKPSVRMIREYPLIGIRNVPLENVYNRFIKRLFDFSLATMGLLAISPFLLVIMVLIKLTSKGPVFFRQKRTGLQQQEFYIYKFRTMLVNPDADKVQATANDPRKTKLGNFLRKHNIDELPQLINIIKGEMSLVGPRPHMIAHTEEFYKKYDKYLVRHWVKPGLTGWAQVNGWRGDSDIGMRVKFDIMYIENWSLLFDIKILFLTVFGKKVKRYAY